MWSILGFIHHGGGTPAKGMYHGEGIPLTKYMSFEWAVASFLAILVCFAMLVKHGIVEIQADRKVNRVGKNSPM